MAPCNWSVSYAACTSCPALEGMTPTERLAFESMAVEYLWRWTHQQFGICDVELRPCSTECCDWTTFWGSGPYPFLNEGGHSWPALVSGKWYNLRRACGCSTACETPGALVLPGPVADVEEILLDGVVFPPTSWRLDGELLFRTDGEAWPTCQDLTLPTTEVGTWQVLYARGTPVPHGGQIAAGILACELAKAACRDVSCALPQRVQTLTRQGVTMAMIDDFRGIEKGHTGIWLIDSWVTSVVSPTRPSRVYSVDVPPRRQGREYTV